MTCSRFSLNPTTVKERLLLLLRTYLLTVLVFIAAKVVFMLACHAGHVFTVSDMAAVIGHGLTLDLSTALYFIMVPFLLTIVSVWWQGRCLRMVLNGYFVVAAVVMALAFVADTSLYPFWHFKLDASCLQYLSTPTEAMASVSTGYLLLRLLVTAVVATLIFFLLRAGRCFPPKALGSMASRIAGTVLLLLFSPVIVVGLRGGFDESTTNIGQVYYSQNQFLNHSAVNPVFSFIASMEKTASANTVYDFFDDETCRRLTIGLYPTESLPPADTLLTTRRPNIVVILLESCGTIFTQAMPNLRRLADEGVAFTQCYGNSYRTDRGTVCALSGYPSFPTMSVMKMPAKTRTLPALSKTLRCEGYRTHYLYGGDINFTNMRSYLITTGFERLTWKADYTSDEQQTAEWGVRDDITFQTLYDMIAAQPMEGKPFLIGFSTLSTHEPWDVPVHKLDDLILNAFSYLDQCIAQLVDRLKKTPQWDNLLIVLLPDHSINYDKYDEQHPQRNLIPLVWLGGAVKSPRQVNVICNQTDLPATLLAQMGIAHDDYPYSRDVLSPAYTYPFAIHTYNNGFTLTDSTGFMAYDLDAQRPIVSNSADTPRLAEIGKAILQATSKDLARRGQIEE